MGYPVQCGPAIAVAPPALQGCTGGCIYLLWAVPALRADRRRIRRKRALGRALGRGTLSEPHYITTPLQGAVSCDCASDSCHFSWPCRSCWEPVRRGARVLARPTLDLKAAG